MFSPMFYVAVVCGLIAGGGGAIFAAPTAWITAGLDAPRIMQAQQCAISNLNDTALGEASDEGLSQ